MEKDLQKTVIGDIDFVEEKGVIYAKAYDTKGNLLGTSTKHLTNSLDNVDPSKFSRGTKRVIKKWDADGRLIQTMAEGTLAPYWDAAQAAK
jgi:hypothetical protein